MRYMLVIIAVLSSALVAVANDGYRQDDGAILRQVPIAPGVHQITLDNGHVRTRAEGLDGLRYVMQRTEWRLNRAMEADNWLLAVSLTTRLDQLRAWEQDMLLSMEEAQAKAACFCSWPNGCFPGGEFGFGPRHDWVISEVSCSISACTGWYAVANTFANPCPQSGGSSYPDSDTASGTEFSVESFGSCGELEVCSCKWYESEVNITRPNCQNLYLFEDDYDPENCDPCY